MNKLSKKLCIGVVAIMIIFGGLFVAQKAEAFSLQEFVTTLVERGIISSEREEAARTLARFFGDVATPAGSGQPAIEPSRPNTEHISVQASQLIEYASRTYAEGEHIRGLLLNVRNTHTAPIQLFGRAQCHVSYRILSADDRSSLYNSAEHEPCTSGEESSYMLGAGDTRMFEIRHAHETHPLPEGEYVMVMEYPGYGEGELVVTVKND